MPERAQAFPRNTRIGSLEGPTDLFRALRKELRGMLHCLATRGLRFEGELPFLNDRGHHSRVAKHLDHEEAITLLRLFPSGIASAWI
jgi:hypothetical protein